MKKFLLMFLFASAAVIVSQARFYSSRSCNRPRVPRNGQIECDEKSKNHSFCSFSCNDGFRLRGSHHTKCDYGYSYANGRITRYFWTDRSPYCEPASCPPPEGIDNADVECTGHNLGDYCKYECFHKFQIFPTDRIYQDCLSDRKWTSTPCCAEEAHCSRNQKSDVVIAFDSSQAFGAQRWSKMKKFIRSFIDLFSTEEDMSRFSIFRYDNDVDEDSLILLSEFVDDRISLLEAYDEMPDDLNRGHNVSRAMDFIANTVLQEENGDRRDVQDVILLITKERSYGEKHLIVPIFHESYRPKIFVAVVDAFDEFLAVQIKVNSAEDPRNYWVDLTQDLDAIYYAESSSLSGLGTALKRDMSNFVCQIEACSSEF